MTSALILGAIALALGCVVALQAREMHSYAVTLRIVPGCHNPDGFSVGGHRWAPSEPAPSRWYGSVSGAFQVSAGAMSATFVAREGGSETFARVLGNEAYETKCFAQGR